MYTLPVMDAQPRLIMSDRRGDRVYESDRHQRRGFDPGGEVDGVEIERRLHDLRVVRRPVRVARRPAVQRPVRVAPGGLVDNDVGDLRVEPGDGEGLLPAHARPHHDQRVAVPVRPAHHVIDGAVVGQVHLQEIVLVAIVTSDQVIVLQLLGKRVVVRLRLVRQHVVRLDVQGEPALGGPVGDPLSLQRIGAAGPLEDDERRKPARLFRLCYLPVDARAIDVVHPDRGVLDAGPAAVRRREDGILRNPLQQSDF